MDCILHIGVGKAGSSSLQAICESRRSEFKANGILYPDDLLASGKRGGDNHKCLAVSAIRQDRSNAVLAQHRVMSVHGRRKFDNDVLSLYREQIAECPDHLCVLSAEHFWSCLPSDEEIATLSGKMSGLGLNVTRLIVYMRRQSDWFESFVHQRIREGGGVLGLDADTLMATPTATQLDYDAIINQWGNHFPTARIVPRIFDPDQMVGGDIVSDFFWAAGLPSFDYVPARVNSSSVSNAGINAILAMKPKFDALPEEDRKILKWRALVDQVVSSMPGGCSMLRERELRAIDRAYQESNERVRKQYFPEMNSLFSTQYRTNESDSFRPLTGPEFDDMISFGMAQWASGALAAARAAA